MRPESPSPVPFAAKVQPGRAFCRVREHLACMDRGRPPARCGRLTGLLSAEGGQDPAHPGKSLCDTGPFHAVGG